MGKEFDKVYNRRNTGSLKWNVENDELPMWVADMDFKTAPGVQKAILKTAEIGIFGYHVVTDEWYSSIQEWWEQRHHIKFEKDWMTFCTGIVPAITSIIKRITAEDDDVIVQTPVYDAFFHAAEESGRHILENRLKYDGKEYSIDFEDLKEKLSRPSVTAMLLCNPHNPCGNIWTREELEKIGRLCYENRVTVISDEIHCDITDPGYEYTPFASASNLCRDISITCVSPGKSFNIAGLQTSAIIIPDKQLKEKIEKGFWSDRIGEPNSFSIEATVAAFEEGGEWLDELRSYICMNKQYVYDYLEKEIKCIKAVKSNSTYLMWLDCSSITDNSCEFTSFLKEKEGLIVNDGSRYLGNGNGFIRINIGCPLSRVEEGMKKLKHGIDEYIKYKKEVD